MIEELKNKLYNEIPMTKLMKLEIESYDNEKLITSAPLDVNINDKGTAFGGSLNTISIISGWSLCYLITKELGFKSSKIAIIKNNTSFRAPVTKNIYCETFIPENYNLKLLEEKLNFKGSSSIKIYSKIVENGITCLEFEGVYVIKIK